METTKGPAAGNRVNLAELLTRVDDDRELLRDLLAIFKEDFPGHLKSLRDAVARQDRKQTRAISHTLKGMLSNLAVANAAACAGQLENLATGSADEAQVKEALAVFEREVEGLLPEMETYMTEVQS